MIEYLTLHFESLITYQGYEVSQQELNISIESFLQQHHKAENPNEIEFSFILLP